MKNYKKDFVQFLVWMRNGTAFCTSWFLILGLLYNHSWGIEQIATDRLIEMLLFVVGGVFVFCSFFTRVFIRKWSFQKRLNCFMVVIALYECFVFYFTGVWESSGNPFMWIVFFGVILLSYFLCMAIYQVYSRRQGELFTKALQNYQQKRSMENGK